jgi:excisionase family DNA binding protein
MFEQQLGRSVTIDQAADLLQVSRRTIYNRIREGKLLTIRTIGGSQRVLLSSVDENRKFTWGGRVPSARAQHSDAPEAQQPAEAVTTKES